MNPARNPHFRRAFADLIRLGWTVPDIARAMDVPISSAYRHRDRLDERAESVRSESEAFRRALAREDRPPCT